MGTPDINGANTKDLTFISTLDLVEELKKRHDALVVCGMKFTTGTQYEIFRHYSGHSYVCLGMMAQLESNITEKENNELKKLY